MRISTKYNIGDRIYAKPPKVGKEMPCEVIGVSVSVHLMWKGEEKGVETMVFYTLKYSGQNNTTYVFREKESAL